MNINITLELFVIVCAMCNIGYDAPSPMEFLLAKFQILAQHLDANILDR